MRIYLHSCHAVLEYDQARMFTDLGHEVTGVFDIGSVQRPKVEGVTDHNTEYQAASIDVVVMHQTADFALRGAQYAVDGTPTIAIAFGQGCDRQHAALTEACCSGRSR